jgi:nicotinic acid mononucleotide adenylyltransferase
MSINYTPENTFIFSFVRMNPPTPGHMSLVETMINKAIELRTNNIYIITSSSLDGKNPLPCSADAIPKPKNKADASILNEMQGNVIYKSSVLNNMVNAYKQKLINNESDLNTKTKIENINIYVICSVGSPFSFLYNVIKRDFIEKDIPKINMFFIVGRDRADFLDTVVDTFKTKDYINSVNGMVLPREGMESLKNTGLGKRSIADISQSEYSASFIRNLVKNNQREDFNHVYEQYLNPSEIDKLYQTIKSGTQMKSPPSKEEDDNPQSRYFDGGLLPVMGPSSGGRRRRRNTRKHRKTKRRNTKRHIRRHK